MLLLLEGSLALLPADLLDLLPGQVDSVAALGAEPLALWLLQDSHASPVEPFDRAVLAVAGDHVAIQVLWGSHGSSIVGSTAETVMKSKGSHTHPHAQMSTAGFGAGHQHIDTIEVTGRSSNRPTQQRKHTEQTRQSECGIPTNASVLEPSVFDSLSV